MSQYTIFGFTWQGAWSSSTTYQPYDVVSYSGTSYVCVASNTNVNPSTDSGSNWQIAASKGDAGATGPSGVDSSSIVATVTSNTTLSATKGTVLVNLSSGGTITLPSITTANNGDILTFLTIGGSSGALILHAPSGSYLNNNSLQTQMQYGFGGYAVGYYTRVFAYGGLWYTMQPL
jgi:hypothetical protein